MSLLQHIRTLLPTSPREVAFAQHLTASCASSLCSSALAAVHSTCVVGKSVFIRVTLASTKCGLMLVPSSQQDHCGRTTFTSATISVSARRFCQRRASRTHTAPVLLCGCHLYHTAFFGEWYLVSPLASGIFEFHARGYPLASFERQGFKHERILCRRPQQFRGGR